MHPGVVRVADGVQRDQSGDPVIGLVEAPAHLHIPGSRHHDIGFEGADRPCHVAAEREGVHQHAVRMVEYLKICHTHLVAGGALLQRAQRAHFSRRSLHPSLSRREQQVGHLGALIHPAVDAGGQPVLDVVRVRHDAQNPAECLVGQRLNGSMRSLAHDPDVFRSGALSIPTSAATTRTIRSRGRGADRGNHSVPLPRTYGSSSVRSSGSAGIG